MYFIFCCRDYMQCTRKCICRLSKLNIASTTTWFTYFRQGTTGLTVWKLRHVASLVDAPEGELGGPPGRRSGVALLRLELGPAAQVFHQAPEQAP